MKKLLLVIFLLPLFASAQILKPVHWSFSAERTSEKEANLVMTAKIDPKWHLYSQFIGPGGPEPTAFTFTASGDYATVGKVSESPKPTSIFDETFEMQVKWFVQKAVFRQKISLKSKAETTVEGNVYFMTCDDHQCLPPEEIPFSIKVPAFTGKSVSTTVVEPKTTSTSTEKVAAPVNTVVDTPKEAAKITVDSSATAPKVEPITEKEAAPATISSTLEQAPAMDMAGIWKIFIGGLLGGFAAFLMPCIFPMLPLTVSYFTKRAGSQKGGVGYSLLYGLSIIVIYVALGLGVTLVFGSSKLNELASDGIFNFVFFLLLVVFAFSFLGAFELQLPSSWVNKMDEKSDSKGLGGIFFMAFTLALVSFSCTGPIIGTLLVDAASKGALLGPAIGMFGFALALALPFTLFSVFPNWMNSLPKSGGWLNSVKVVLGFLELAFSLKFLSNVDLAYHWEFLDREVFLVIWIVLFALLGLYLLGKIKFAHDSDLPYVSVTRLTLATLSLAFSMYMIPGLWGAPLNAISAFAPPQATQDFDLSTIKTSSAVAPHNSGTHKYAELFHCPHNLDCFFDYEEGMAYAKKVNKPVFIDFTGHTCVNCRKMEASVWSDARVLERMNNDYVVISLYVDDKTDLPIAEQYIAPDGTAVKTIGKKWHTLQSSRFGTNSQPYYVLLDHEGKELNKPRAFDQDIEAYIQFLEEGKKAFSKSAN